MSSQTGPAVKQDNTSLLVKIAITVGCVNAAILSQSKHFEPSTVALIALAVFPWIASSISEISIMGNKLKLRVAQNTQDIETMKLLVQSVLTDVELELLGRLRAELAYKTDTQGPFYPGFKAALDHLIGLHFIEERYKGAYPAFEARKTESDANEFFRIRSDGKDFLKQYEKLLGVIDLEQLDRITGGRIGL